jgi:hypothetical protein
MGGPEHAAADPGAPAAPAGVDAAVPPVVADPAPEGLVRSEGWGVACAAVVVAVFVATAVLLPITRAVLATFGPVRSVPAVVTAAGPVRSFTPEGGIHLEYVVEARVDGGGTRRVGGGERFARQLSVGEPVVLRQARFTGQIIAVRTVERYLRKQPHAGHVAWVVIGLVLIGAVVAVPLGAWARWLWRSRDPAAIVGTVVVVTLVVVISPLLSGGTIDRPPLRDDVGMGVYGILPEQTAGPGGTVEVGDFAVEVTGPVHTGPPPGSPAWLGDFHVVVVPVRVGFAGAADHVRPIVALIGPGPGRAYPVPPPACGGPDPFADEAAGAAGGAVCFAVPPGFQPRYLILSGASQAALQLTAG